MQTLDFNPDTDILVWQVPPYPELVESLMEIFRQSPRNVLVLPDNIEVTLIKNGKFLFKSNADLSLPES